MFTHHNIDSMQGSTAAAHAEGHCDEGSGEMDVRPLTAGPSFHHDDTSPGRDEQLPMDIVDEESMESFPCSDPPSYSTCHA